jgi:hypothetical protein
MPWVGKLPAAANVPAAQKPKAPTTEDTIEKGLEDLLKKKKKK